MQILFLNFEEVFNDVGMEVANIIEMYLIMLGMFASYILPFVMSLGTRLSMSL